MKNCHVRNWKKTGDSKYKKSLGKKPRDGKSNNPTPPSLDDVNIKSNITATKTPPPSRASKLGGNERNPTTRYFLPPLSGDRTQATYRYNKIGGKGKICHEEKRQGKSKQSCKVVGRRTLWRTTKGTDLIWKKKNLSFLCPIWLCLRSEKNN